MKISGIFYLMFFLVISSSYASEGGREPFYDVIWHDITYFGDDFLYIGSGIINPGSSTLLGAGGIVTAAGLSMTLDDEARQLFRQEINRNNYKWLEYPNYYGNVFYVGALCGGTYLGGLIAGDENIRTTGRLMAESVLLSGTFTTLIKIVAGRARPFTGHGCGYYTGFNLSDNFQSLPSGHTTVAFAMSTVLSGRINTWWAYAGFYGLATLTGAARIYYDRHWLSDVVLGAGIGTLSGLAILNADKSRNKAGQTGFSFIPQPAGFSLIYRF